MSAKSIAEAQLDLHGQLSIFSPGYYPDYDPSLEETAQQRGFRLCKHVITILLKYDHQECYLSVFRGSPNGHVPSQRNFSIPIMLEGENLQLDSEPEDYYGEIGASLGSGYYLLKIFHTDTDEVGRYGTPKARIEIYAESIEEPSVSIHDFAGLVLERENYSQ